MIIGMDTDDLLTQLSKKTVKLNPDGTYALADGTPMIVITHPADPWGELSIWLNGYPFTRNQYPAFCGHWKCTDDRTQATYPCILLRG